MKAEILKFKDGYKAYVFDGDRSRCFLAGPDDHVHFDFVAPIDSWSTRELKVTHMQWLKRWAK